VGGDGKLFARLDLTNPQVVVADEGLELAVRRAGRAVAPAAFAAALVIVRDPPGGVGRVILRGLAVDDRLARLARRLKDGQDFAVARGRDPDVAGISVLAPPLVRGKHAVRLAVAV